MTTTLRLARSATTLLLLLIFLRADAAAKAAPFYVEPYLEGLAPAVVALKGLVETALTCKSRRLQCGRMSDEVLGIMDEQRAELSHIDIIDVSGVDVPAPPLPGAPVPLEFDVRRERFLAAVYDYDLMILANYDAATRRCPRAGSSVNVPLIAQKILRQFWELDAADLAPVMTRLETASKERYQQLAASGADCAAVRDLGLALAVELRQRSRNYQTLPGKRASNRKLGASVEQVWDIVAALEIEAGNEHFIHWYLRDDLIRANCISVVNVSPRCRSLIAAPEPAGK